MKKIILFLFISIFTQSCKVNETPEFIKVSNIDVANYTAKEITLTSDLVFHNPNYLGGVLQAKDITVFANNIDMGNINSPDFKVPAQEEFIVPIEFKFSYDKVFEDQENLLINVLNTLTSKKIEVKYQGTITYKLNIFSYDYPLDYSQEINLKK